MQPCGSDGDHRVHSIKSIGWLIETSPHVCIRIDGGAV